MSIEHNPGRRGTRTIPSRYLRFRDLVDLGVVRNRDTLYRWIRECGFPAGVLLGPNTRAFHGDDVQQWVTEREDASA